MLKVRFFIIFSFLTLTLAAQVPYGIKHSLPDLEEQYTYTLSGYTAAKLDEADNADNPVLPSIGRLFDAGITPKTHGEWRTIPGGILWRIKITLEGARGVSVIGKAKNIPEGAVMSIYSPGGKNTESYKSADFSNTPYFSSHTITGSEIMVEYFEPDGKEGLGEIIIEKVVYKYRLTESGDNTDVFGAAGACMVNVNCTEGDDWSAQKRSVVKIDVFSGIFNRICTGTLMNNTRKDFRPYILTAMHCGLNDNFDDIAHDTMFNYWKFYFNYEAPTCANPISEGNLADQRILGAQVKAHSNDSGGFYGSDFLLVELNQVVPPSWLAYYAGWSIDTTVSFFDSGVCIHHPQGDIKKISTYTFPRTKDDPYPGLSPDNTHWLVTWSATPNGKGVTQSGSSGSPLFEGKDNLVVGTLTGGNTSCSSLTGFDLFGRLDWHWNRHGTDSNRRLDYWLDPLKTGTKTWYGSDWEPAGIAEINRLPLEVYPNPAGNSLSISYPGFKGNETAKVFVTSTVGNTVVLPLQPGGVVDVSAFAAGIYFIEINDGKLRYTTKFVKD
ncbi:MAG TPA: T9SS type A sorting domain-containing protein [Bacteroidia bacterium]|nr:T9SS type A sorting domain-containing protein [Bacteroidia bacterium]